MRSTPRALLCMVLLLGSFSGSAFAALCADVFPQDATPGTVARLDLSVMDKPGVEYKSFPAKGEDYLVSGDYFYRGGRLDNGAEITVTKGRPVRIFIDGDTDFQPHAEININGSAEDLLIVVRGNLDIGTKNRINALIYATKNISANPDVRVEGAMTAEGSISTKVKDVIVYDEAAAQGFSSGDLCTPGGGMVVDHYRLSFPTPQFSCEPIPVLIRACADANCSRTVPVTKTLTVTPTNRWLGNGTVTFVDSDTATAYLKRIPGSLQLGVVGDSYRCSNGDCGLEILRSGFRLAVPNLIAGKPEAAALQALRLDGASGACVADGSFAGSQREIAFWSSYDNPVSGTQSVQINAKPIGGAASAATPVALTFDNQATSPLQVRYDDAGAVQLHARFVGSGEEEGLEMRGSTLLASRPYGVCIQADGPGCSTVDCPLFAPKGQPVRAGDPFDLRVTPVGVAASPSQADLCAAPPTPNFVGTLELDARVVTPAAGVDGVLERADYAHPLGGTHVLKDQKLYEVGSFRINVRSAAYLGGAGFDSEGPVLGRFAPAYLAVGLNAPALAPGCMAGGGFSYQGEDIDFAHARVPELTITGMSRNGTVTRNHDRVAWKLNAQLKPVLTFAAGQLQDATRLRVGTFELQPDGSAGDGSRLYRMDGQVRYERHPNGPQPVVDAPFSPELVLALPAGQLTYAEDGDQTTCHGAAGCVGFESEPFGFQTPGGEIRLGRIRVGSAHGPEHAPLDLPYQVETWQSGNAFVPDGSDACAVITGVQLGSYTGQLEGKTQAQVSALAQGRGVIRLTAPGPGGEGSVVVTPQVPDWLTYDWKGDGFENPSGLATFGIYKGNEKIIFRREAIGR